MFRILTLTIACLLIAALPVLACNVPVFRYSLERWQPDRYEIVVIQREPLTAEQKNLVDSLAKQSDRCNIGKNVAFININEVGAEDRDKLTKRYNIAQFPWLIVRYPDHVDSGAAAYSGPIESDRLQNLLDSPARTELARRLLKGDSAVWLLLESGDRQKDDDIEAKLKTWLASLEKTIKLPELSNSPKDKLLREDLPLKTAFAILRVSRTAAAEKHFVHILSHMEKNLSTTEPVVVPVFGRGLALYAIVGKGITERNVTEAATFLTGKCSCEVKQLNPGVDLLMTADWDGPPGPQKQGVSTEPAAQAKKPAAVTLVRKEVPQPGAETRTEGSAASDSSAEQVSPATGEKAPDASFAPLDGYGGIGLVSAAVLLIVAIGLYSAARFGSNK